MPYRIKQLKTRLKEQVISALCSHWGNASDECGAGSCMFFSPSSTTYVKHCYSSVQGYDGSVG